VFVYQRAARHGSREVLFLLAHQSRHRFFLALAAIQDVADRQRLHRHQLQLPFAPKDILEQADHPVGLHQAFLHGAQCLVRFRYFLPQGIKARSLGRIAIARTRLHQGLNLGMDGGDLVLILLHLLGEVDLLRLQGIDQKRIDQRDQHRRRHEENERAFAQAHRVDPSGELDPVLLHLTASRSADISLNSTKPGKGGGAPFTAAPSTLGTAGRPISMAAKTLPCIILSWLSRRI